MAKETTYEEIARDLKNRVYKPVYYLMGEESYYIDRISDYIAQTVLTEEEKEFNQTVLYGSDTDIATIINAAKRYPMMAEHQVVCLARRFRCSKDFPHEIGLFLGYPPEDVRGFMEQGSRACKCVGCWKVYGDVEAAQKRFDTFRSCKDCYLRCVTRGNTIEQLAVAG